MIKAIAKKMSCVLLFLTFISLFGCTSEETNNLNDKASSDSSNTSSDSIKEDQSISIDSNREDENDRYNEIKNVLLCQGHFTKENTLIVDICLCGDVEVFAFDLQFAYKTNCLTVKKYVPGDFDTNEIQINHIDSYGIFRLNSFEMNNGFKNVSCSQRLLSIEFAVEEKNDLEKMLEINYVDMYKLDEKNNEIKSEYKIVYELC